MNMYYNPEDFGLQVVGEVEWYEPDYSFDTTVVWKNEDGKLYWASDSGCSCPAPFEDYRKLEDLETGTEWDVIKYLQACLEEYQNGNSYAEPQVVDLISKIRAL